VTDANKHQVVCAAVRYRLLESRKAGLLALRAGFAAGCDGLVGMLQLWSVSELQQLTFGATCFDWRELWDGTCATIRTILA
jgi:hypothetical protein